MTTRCAKCGQDHNASSLWCKWCQGYRSPDRLQAVVAAAILDAQIRAMERRRIDTPEEIRAAALTKLEGGG